ncbi:MAG: hypothetical protein AMXMBFR13_24760 [Phycisphaerae bacterium]
MKLEVMSNTTSLCDQCVGLCCRYFAFSIDKPETKRDFEDLRWYILHEDTLIFVEDGEWYVQINRKCRALLPDNRCGIYENRPTICRSYKTDGCDWQADAYDYQHVFCEPEQIEKFAREYLAAKRKKARTRAKPGQTKTRRPAPKRTKRRRLVKTGVPLHLLMSA